MLAYQIWDTGIHHNYYTGIPCYRILTYMDIVMEYCHTFPAILAYMLICYIQHWHTDPVTLACTGLHWQQTGFCKFVLIWKSETITVGLMCAHDCPRLFSASVTVHGSMRTCTTRTLYAKQGCKMN